MKENNNNDENVKIIPVVTYTSASINKLNIYKENNNKSGIYR
jgi:hypothetical protein